MPRFPDTFNRAIPSGCCLAAVLAREAPAGLQEGGRLAALPCTP